MSSVPQQPEHIYVLSFNVNLSLINSIEHLNSVCNRISAEAKEIIYRQIFNLAKLQPQEITTSTPTETKE